MPHAVPLMVESGLHQATVFRQLVHNANKGQEGISDAFDCRVTALDVPDAYVQAYPGTYSVLNRAAGYVKEMYAGRITSLDKVPISPTTSSGARTDLVIIRILNPDVEAVSPPADRDNGPYAVTQVLQGVPSTTTSVLDVNQNISAIAIARISIPASTGAITNSMITDLRSVIPSPYPAPAQFNDVQNYNTTSTLPPPPSGAGTRFSNWSQWPAGAQWNVPVPSWATEVQLYYQVNPYLGDNTWGGMSIIFNGRWSQEVVFDVNYPLISGVNRCQFTNAGGMRAIYIVAGKLAVTSADRGKVVPVQIQARTYDSTSYGARGNSYADRGSVGFFQATFKQSAVYV